MGLPKAVPAKLGSLLHVAGSQPSAFAVVITSMKDVGSDIVPDGTGAK